MARGKLVQRKPAIGGFDEKLRSFQSDLRDSYFGGHIAAPRENGGRLSSFYNRFRYFVTAGRLTRPAEL
jgi:hypothetical protein